MNRKLTDKEAAFLLELRDLMAKHNAIVFAEDGRVCFDVEYSDVDDPVEPGHAAGGTHGILRN